MYPFNRAENNLAQNASIIDMEEPDRRNSLSPNACFVKIEQNGNSHIARRKSNISIAESDHSAPVSKNDKLEVNGSLMEDSKNVLADLLEISFSRKSWNRPDTALDLESHGLFMGIGRNMYSITNSLNPILIILRCLGYFPGFVRYEKREKQQILVYRAILYLLVIIGICLNLYFFRDNVLLVQFYHVQFGFLHSLTVSHIKMLRVMNNLDLSFRSAFQISPPIRIYNIVFITAILFIFTVPFCYRIYDVLKERAILQDTGKPFGWMVLSSFVTVPLLTVWNVIPLFYYVFANCIVCFWCKTLKNSLKREHVQRQFSLKFYYEQFLRITALQKSIGSLFNPFVFFSLACSLLMLSLTIYFITQPASSIIEPITEKQMSSEAVRIYLSERVYLNLGWSIIQISVAMLHIVVICWTGVKTNEETRKIINTVLAIVPDANADLDRFQISCFVHKMQFQNMFGMTVWRTFPLERTTFFTLISVIFTYSFLLLKLKDNPSISPIVRQVVYLNSSNAST
ncbi:Egl-47 [Aphelenchoides bicaudatus]|nr:Egl-47 [Aphelenchoides bicaudatus]